MWNTETIELEKDRITKIKISKDGVTLSKIQVIENWIKRGEFRDFYNSILKQSKFESFFWENPSISEKDINGPYEFVLIQSDLLYDVRPDSNSFHEYFNEYEKTVTFGNLGGDAILIVPTPAGKNDHYTHLGNFVRKAGQDQIDHFWKFVGQTYQSSICKEKRWLSTSGLGVNWIHVRIDSKPKYYQFMPYR